MRARILIALLNITALRAQDSAVRAEARAMDKEIQQLPNLPESKRDAAFREMLQRIRKVPKQYRRSLPISPSPP